MNVLDELQKRFRTALATLIDDPEPYVEMVRPSGDVRHGDYQANCAMPLGGQLGRPPREVAEELVDAARCGLQRQVEAGRFSADALDLLEPLRLQVESGQSPGQAVLDRLDRGIPNAIDTA